MWSLNLFKKSYKGTITKGLGYASIAIKMQKENGLLTTLSFLKHYCNGSINVNLEKSFDFNNHFSIVTPRIKWNADYPAETFTFYPVWLEVNNQKVKAFIYKPEFTPHRNKLDYVEIMSVYLDIAPGMKCRITPIDR